MADASIVLKADVTRPAGQHDNGPPRAGGRGKKHTQPVTTIQGQMENPPVPAMVRGNGGRGLTIMVLRESH
ncbi:hypothetical protein Gain_0002_013 [Komagataeibacter intermedius TF2]|uniref:Transposase n=1 Tax=Komagataeibacter intermedius NRIC 0521 TaxID=1307934 RepID=A0ABQ0PF07_9PROT|nr:hypothetical protein Gain_0002_013 [Komagataeibacter intermedius TF2]GBQ65852.1 hypothetical protein AA0521_0563 [Komagataeibacter intermedius NRIC 0521]